MWGGCRQPSLAAVSSAHTGLALLPSVLDECVSSGRAEDFFETLTQNSHGNNSLKESHILLMEL